jgi:hypothetical protein
MFNQRPRDAAKYAFPQGAVPEAADHQQIRLQLLCDLG